MDSGQVISVNTGRVVKADWAGRIQRTAIEKHPADGAVRVGRLGLDGDEQADLENHGGPEQLPIDPQLQPIQGIERIARPAFEASAMDGFPDRAVDLFGVQVVPPPSGNP